MAASDSRRRGSTKRSTPRRKSSATAPRPRAEETKVVSPDTHGSNRGGDTDEKLIIEQLLRSCLTEVYGLVEQMAPGGVRLDIQTHFTDPDPEHPEKPPLKYPGIGPNAPEVAGTLSREISRTAGFPQLVSLLITQPGVALLARGVNVTPPSEGAAERAAVSRLIELMVKRVCCQHAWHIDEEKWADQWPRLWKVLQEGYAFKGYAPILGLRVSRTIAFNGFSIRPLDYSERVAIARLGLGHSSWTTAEEAVATIELHPGKKKADGLIDHALTVIRLQGYDVAIPAEIATADFSHTAAKHRPLPPYARYELQDGDALESLRPEITTLLAGLASMPKAVETAVQRFNLTFDIPRRTDRILDQGIVLEALFLNSDSKTEIAHRLRLRAARMLGKTFDERKAIVALVKSLYDLRSSIAHGGAGLADQGQQAEIDRLVRHALRQVLSYVADNPGVKTLKVLHEELDDGLLR